MIIKEFNALATTNVRSDILTIAEAGYEAISIPHLIGKKLSLNQNTLTINNSAYDLDAYQNIYVVAVGKGSGLICEALEKLLTPSRITAGVAIDLKSRKLEKIEVFSGTHPLPSEENITATKKLVDVLKPTTDKDLIIAVICGGGSSLACWPGKNLTCEDLQKVSDHLLKSSATISEINTVRKHLSQIHGGYLAKYAYPSTVLGLVISDVPGDDLTMVASGPISRDTTTLDEAQAIATKYGLPNLALSETPKEDKYFKNVSLELLANGQTALQGMSNKAKELGFDVKIFSTEMSGLAKDIGPKMATTIEANQALLACGESQVIVTKPGMGGRNQDLALSALTSLPPKSAIISAASDGKDNIDVAGALVDAEQTSEEIKTLHIQPDEVIANNQSYKTLSKIQGIYHIDKITANVSDFVVVLRKA